jgi:hypothetical protein
MYSYPQFKEQDYVIPLFQVGGSALANMPANDGVEIISDSASDVNLITVLGTKYGSNVLITETIKMTGTNAVSLVETAWNNVYGFFLGDVNGKFSTVAVGTITVREASGNATIGTIVAGNRSTGSLAFKLSGKDILLHNASGNTLVNVNNKLIYPTINNAFKYTAGMADDIKVSGDGYIYLLGDISGSTVQIKVLQN